MIQAIKDYLVKRGPESLMVQGALKLHASRSGFRVRFSEGKIRIQQKNRAVILANKDFYLVPIFLECFALTFEDLEPDSTASGVAMLDFSGPGAHRYRRHGIELQFPGIAEDDSIAAYTHRYKPHPGDLVFDIGAHAGFTTCMLARMVGPEGQVIAFEPDEVSGEYLTQNVKRLGLTNVAVVPKAIDAKTGTAQFNADGTMGPG